MSDTSIHKTSVDLDGLLEVLGKNLYSTPSVALRELIQNANDACQRRAIEQDFEQKLENRVDFEIELTVNADKKTLTIADNGSGLTHQEIQDFLATIGSGYSRVLRNQTQSEEIIGYFGLGFLSAYVVSSQVEVTTLSYQTPDTPWQFRSAKGKTFAISPGQRSAIGTTVVLHLEEDFHLLAQRDFLRGLIQRYCGLLPLSIRFSDETEAINNHEIPWLLPMTMPEVRLRKTSLAFATYFERSFTPLVVFNIPRDNPLGLNGLLWVQDGGTFSSSDNRNVSVFCRRMFISEEERDLLPRWAGFCGGVIDSPNFLPTASRESLQRNDFYHKVQEYLHELLATELRRVVLEEPASWRTIVARHSQALLAAAIADDRLFETMHKSLKLPTTDGDLSVTEVLKKSGNQIVVKIGSETGHEEILFRARGIPLVKGFLNGAATFCDKHKKLLGTHVEILGTKESQAKVFPPVNVTRKEHEAIYRALFEVADTDLVFTRFDPVAAPLIVMENQEVLVKRRIEDDQADRRIASAILSLARTSTAETTKENSRTLFLNLDNPVVQALPDLMGEDRAQAARLMLSLMEFLTLGTVSAKGGVEGTFELFNASLTHFITS